MSAEAVQVLAWQDDQGVATAAGFVRDGAGRLGGVYVTAALRSAGRLARLVEPVGGWPDPSRDELTMVQPRA